MWKTQGEARRWVAVQSWKGHRWKTLAGIQRARRICDNSRVDSVLLNTGWRFSVNECVCVCEWGRGGGEIWSVSAVKVTLWACVLTFTLLTWHRNATQPGTQSTCRHLVTCWIQVQFWGTYTSFKYSHLCYFTPPLYFQKEMLSFWV